MSFSKGKGGGDSDGGVFDPLLARQLANSGLLEGGIIQSFDNAPATRTLNITAGSGYIIDNTDPTDSVLTSVSFAAQPAYQIQNQAGQGIFIIGIDKNGDTQEISFFDIDQNDNRKNHILVGSYGVQSTFIIAITDAPLNLGYDGITTSHDFIRDVIGPATINGLLIKPTAPILELERTSGNIFIISSNFRNSTTDPDRQFVAAQNPLQFFKVLREGGMSNRLQVDGGVVTVVNPGQYDNDGTLATVSSNNWSVQVVYISPTGVNSIAYGQRFFSSQGAAESAVFNGTLDFIEEPTLQAQVRRLFLVVKGNATDLQSSSQATFIDEGKFRGGGVNAGSGIPGINNPGGSDTNVQFNDAGAFQGESDFIYIKTSKLLKVGTTAGGNIQAVGNTAGPTQVGGDILFGPAATPGIVSRVLNNLGVGSNDFPETGSGDANVFFGVAAGQALNNGNSNILFGTGAGLVLTDGNNNIYIGNQAGNNATIGSNNILIGPGLTFAVATTGDHLSIGNLLQGDLSTGRASIGNVGGQTNFDNNISLNLTSTTNVLKLNTLSGNPTGQLINGSFWFDNDFPAKYKGVIDGSVVTFTTT